MEIIIDPVTTETNPLLILPAAALALVVGDLRKRLVRYLSRWGHHATLISYFEAWLLSQPGSVTLREGRARVLTDTGQGAAALAMLDGLDAERPPTVTRRQLRLRALLASQQFEQAHALIDALSEEPDQLVYSWLQRGDAYRAEGRYDDAAAAYAQAALIEPPGPAHARRMAELALDLGDAEAARGYIDALMLRPDFSPTVADLELLLRAARMDQHPSEGDLAAQLAAHEAEERIAVAGELGLHAAAKDEDHGLVDVPAEASPPVGGPAERGLPSEAYTALRELFALNDFRPNQARVISQVLAGRSSLAIMPTGAGKSLTYQLPAMLLDKATVVVSPLIALMKDQIEGLPPAVRERSTLINSTLSAAELSARLRDIAAGRYKLVYIAPERLRQRPFLHALKRLGVSLFVVDEAHCVSLWGLNFRPDYLFIGQARSELGDPTLLALTATASAETQREIEANLGMVEPISASVFRPNLFFQVLKAGNRDEKQQMLVELCKQIEGPIIVYARARQACEELAAVLRRAGIAADHYHAGVEGRDAAQERFMRGQTRVLAATVAFGMGIDKSNIRAIIHYNLSASLEAYLQEAGRAGRDGAPARCILLYASSDKARLTSWLNEGAMTRDRLREIYRAVRAQMGGRFEIVDLAAAQRTIQDEDETMMRVGLSMLERVGLLRRHFDQPRRAMLTLRGPEANEGFGGRADHAGTGAVAAPPALDQIIALADLQPDATVEVDLIDLAERAAISPVDLESWLLSWHDEGLLRYRPGQRGPLLELLPAPPDVGERIDRLLADYQARQDQRVESVGSYARAAKCRHRVLSAHFGQKLAACRTACDICAPERGLQAGNGGGRRTLSGPLPQRDSDDGRSDVQRILDGLHNLPFPMGRSGLARALKGGSNSPIEAERCAEVGALRHLPLNTIEELIERLIEAAYLARDERDEYRRLSLSITGKKARRDPSYLPEWES